MIELYRYTIRPGCREEWERFMCERAIPHQTSQGMVILGHFWDHQDESTYWWMRRFEGQEHRDALYDKVYQSDFWINVMRPEVWRLAEKGSGRTTVLLPTAASTLR